MELQQEQKKLQIHLHKQASIRTTSRLIRILRLLDLADDEVESLADVLVVARAGLGVGAIELLGQRFALLDGDLALLGTEIALVAYDHDGDPFGALESDCISFEICEARIEGAWEAGYSLWKKVGRS